jgi:5-methylthioadenosine/S-adenosylhomocysteine deaminase
VLADRIGPMLRMAMSVAIAAGSVIFLQGPKAISLIVTGGTVVTLDGARRVLAPGAVAIDGGAIIAVGDPAAIGAQYRAADTIAADGDVVLPGLINTHTHAPMVMYRGLADDLALMEWLEKYIFPAEAKTVTPAFVRTGTRLAALEMIQSGTTLYTDMYYFEEEIARVTKEAGLRGVLGESVIGFPAPDAKTPADGLARAERFLQEFANDELIVPAVAPHSMYTVDAKTLTASRALADKYGKPTLIHLAETRDEIAISEKRFGTRPALYLESLNFWGPRVLAAHGVWLTKPEIDVLKKRGVGVSHNPESNMKLASGTAPVLELRAAGVPVGIGTDGAASNNDLDMFEAMRMTAMLHKLQSNDPRAIPASAALEMATLGGARALGLGDRLGSLEAGKRADLIVVSMASARQTPMYDPVSHLVYVTRGDDVKTTIVNGRMLMKDRKVLTLDERAVLADARRAADEVRKAVDGSAHSR